MIKNEKIKKNILIKESFLVVLHYMKNKGKRNCYFIIILLFIDLI